MEELGIVRWRLKRRRILRGHLDEIAQYIIVPNLERFDAGLLGIVRLQLGDDFLRVIAQLAMIIEFLRISRFDEAAIAGIERQILAQHRGKIIQQVCWPVGQDRLRPGQFG